VTVRLNTYLNFRDEARPAMELYRSVFGGELTTTTFGESGMSGDPAEAGKVMHSELNTPDGFVLMGSDTPSGMATEERGGFAVSLSGDDEPRLRGWWEALVDGGEVTLPLERAPWGDLFGMCTDRFGTSWMVSIAAPSA